MIPISLKSNFSSYDISKMLGIINMHSAMLNSDYRFVDVRRNSGPVQAAPIKHKYWGSVQYILKRDLP